MLAFDVHGWSKAGWLRRRQLVERALASQDPDFRPAALGAIGQPAADTDVATWLLDEFKDDAPAAAANGWHDPARYHASTAAPATWAIAGSQANFEELISGNGGIFFASRLPQMLRRLSARSNAPTRLPRSAPALCRQDRRAGAGADDRAGAQLRRAARTRAGAEVSSLR